MRTTSSLESLNAVLRRGFPLHPHIFKFMERLQYHEFGQQLKMFKLVKEDPSMSRKKLQRRRQKYQLRNAKIKACTEQLRTNESFTVGEFLECLSTGADLPDMGKKNCVAI